MNSNEIIDPGYIGNIARGHYVDAPPPPHTPPLTNTLMESISQLNAQTADICGSLYSLRDRLFGPQIEPGPTTSGALGLSAAKGPESFADAHQNARAVLAQSITTIERLVHELNARL